MLPFGLHCSAFWWVRFYNIVHKILKKLLHFLSCGSLLYIDDKLYAKLAQFAPLYATVILNFLCLLGVLLTWRKLGARVSWVGYVLDFQNANVFSLRSMCGSW